MGTNKWKMAGIIASFSIASFMSGFWINKISQKPEQITEGNTTIENVNPEKPSETANDNISNETNHDQTNQEKGEDAAQEEERILAKNDLLKDETEKTSSKKEAISSSNGVKYANEKYGFQVKFPEGWEKYKAKEEEDRIEISLPSKNGEYQLNDDKISEYSPVVDILFWTIDDWKKYQEECEKNPSPNCFTEDSIISGSNKYVFAFSASSSALPDLSLNQKEDMNYLDFIRKSFSPLK